MIGFYNTVSSWGKEKNDLVSQLCLHHRIHDDVYQWYVDNRACTIHRSPAPYHILGLRNLLVNP